MKSDLILDNEILQKEIIKIQDQRKADDELIVGHKKFIIENIYKKFELER